MPVDLAGKSVLYYQKNRKRAKVRPDEIRAFKREVRANCPAAPAAVSAARADHCIVREGRRAQNRCCKPEDLPCAPRSAFSRGMRGIADLTPTATDRASYREALRAVCRRFFRASCPFGDRALFFIDKTKRRILMIKKKKFCARRRAAFAVAAARRLRPCKQRRHRIHHHGEHGYARSLYRPRGHRDRLSENLSGRPCPSRRDHLYHGKRDDHFPER